MEAFKIIVARDIEQGKSKLKGLLTKARQQANSPAPYVAGAVAELNKMIYDLYISKDLFPVSLKAPGKTLSAGMEYNRS